jgi:hypothetical protein
MEKYREAMQCSIPSEKVVSTFIKRKFLI